MQTYYQQQLQNGGQNNQLDKNQKNKNNHPFKAMIEVKSTF